VTTHIDFVYDGDTFGFIIVSDYKLPGMDGLEFLERIL